MKVPFLDLSRESRELGPEIEAAVKRVLQRAHYILGPEVQAFEDAFAAFCGTRQAVGVASGTDALYLTMRALGIGPGDEVITTPLSAFATAAAILHTGARPVFADIEPETLTLDPRSVARKITQATRAILPVHLYGLPADTDSLRELASGHGLWLIEDACQAHGACLDNRKAGSLGDAGCFSFYPTKNLGAAGDAGMVTTDDEELAERIRRLRNYGERSRFDNPTSGVNSRLDELQAAILAVKLKYLEARNRRRRELACVYFEQLRNVGLRLPRWPTGREPNFHLFVIRSGERDELRAFLQKRGVGTAIHYPRLIYQQPAFENSQETCPVAEEAVSKILSLPLYPQMSSQEQQYVCDSIRQFFS